MFPGFDVNLKDNANVRYNVTTSYTLTITCTDGSTSDTAELTINLTPNPKPTFDNWQGITNDVIIRPLQSLFL